jgi:hypothetical protein
VSERTAVYRLFDSIPEVIYIGVSRRPGHRIYVHRGRAWWAEVADLSIEWHPSRKEAFAAERAAIKAERPRYNIAETPFHLRVGEYYCNGFTEEEAAKWIAADTDGGRMLARKLAMASDPAA